MKAVGFPKEVKRCLGQNSASTAKEELDFEEKGGNDEATSSAQVGKEGTVGQDDPLLNLRYLHLFN